MASERITMCFAWMLWWKDEMVKGTFGVQTDYKFARCSQPDVGFGCCH